MSSVIFDALNSRKVNVLPQKNGIVILLTRSFLVSSRGENVLFEAQCKFGKSRCSSGLSLFYRTGHAFLPPKQIDFEPEFGVSVGRTCGSSPQLFLRREVMCV